MYDSICEDIRNFKIEENYEKKNKNNTRIRY